MTSLLVHALALAILAAGQREPAGTPAALQKVEASESEQRLEIVQEAASKYKLYVGKGHKHELIRSAAPVLRFDDPVTKAAQGLVYVWTDKQHRPLAIASLYFQGNGDRVDEFQSLASGGELAAEFAGAVVWQPATPGIDLKPLAGKDEVPATKELRLSSMRNIARRFSASVTDSAAGRLELRLLPQPLHRYQDAESGLVDGAIFSFGKGTNPEVLLLVEARSNGGRTQWHYALARMSGRECFARYNDRDIWTATAARYPQTPDEAYFNRVTP